MKQQRVKLTDARIRATMDDFAVRLSLANAKVLRAAMDRRKRRKKSKATGHAAS